MACSSMFGNILLKIRLARAAVFLFCSCLFLVQLFRILPNYLYPITTNTVVKNVPLKNMDFPLDFKVCFQPAVFNETALRSYGYEDMVAYINGIRNYYDSTALIGWGGHGNQPGGNASEVLHAAKKDWTMSQIFNYFQVWPHSENQSAVLQRINWISDIPRICHGRPCKFFLPSIIFFRCNAKNWRFLQI